MLEGRQNNPLQLTRPQLVSLEALAPAGGTGVSPVLNGGDEVPLDQRFQWAILSNLYPPPIYWPDDPLSTMASWNAKDMRPKRYSP